MDSYNGNCTTAEAKMLNVENENYTGNEKQSDSKAIDLNDAENERTSTNSIKSELSVKQKCGLKRIIVYVWVNKSIIIYPWDVFSDLLQGANHFRNGHLYWSFFTFLFTALPCILTLLNVPLVQMVKVFKHAYLDIKGKNFNEMNKIRNEILQFEGMVFTNIFVDSWL